MANAGKKMGGGVAGNRAGPNGHQAPGKPGKTTETDLAEKKMGEFGQQGKAKERLTNERDAMPDVRQEADGVIESFEKLDKDVRAREDLGKGRRHSGDHSYNEAAEDQER
jgi:hypothetical protein